MRLSHVRGKGYWEEYIVKPWDWEEGGRRG